MKLISLLSHSARSRAGFSLIELQVVIAVVALLAAIMVPQIPRLTAQASEAKARVNARNLASVASAANAAGVEFANLDTAIQEVIRPGGVISQIGLRCGVSALSSDEVNAARQYLAFSNGQVVFLAN